MYCYTRTCYVCVFLFARSPAGSSPHLMERFRLQVDEREKVTKEFEALEHNHQIGIAKLAGVNIVAAASMLTSQTQTEGDKSGGMRRENEE